MKIQVPVQRLFINDADCGIVRRSSLFGDVVVIETDAGDIIAIDPETRFKFRYESKEIDLPMRFASDADEPVITEGAEG